MSFSARHPKIEILAHTRNFPTTTNNLQGPPYALVSSLSPTTLPWRPRQRRRYDGVRRCRSRRRRTPPPPSKPSPKLLSSEPSLLSSSQQWWCRCAFLLKCGTGERRYRHCSTRRGSCSEIVGGFASLHGAWSLRFVGWLVLSGSFRLRWFS